jgi:hypothetical protein
LRELNIISVKNSQELGEELENKIERTEEYRNETEPPTIKDVRKATDGLKHNQSPGPDNIIEKLLKIKQKIIKVTLHKIVC